jgi:ATP-binding cassette subfamily B (MDR/TAP) protein 1
MHSCRAVTSSDGRFVFFKFSFSYPSRRDVDVLQGLSLTVEPSQVIALVGETGSGKSTVVSLIERFYDLLNDKNGR